ncbi:MAG: hypothetical protein ABI430_05140 [Candidatus Taylorbacteria bacterium]
MNDFEKDTPIEPQIEKAVRILEAKGYIIGTLAGQSGRMSEKKQAICFSYPKAELGKTQFDEETMQALRDLGVRRFSGGQPADMISLEFDAEIDDFDVIESKWIQIANILPQVKK